MPEILENRIHARGTARMLRLDLLLQRIALVGAILGVWWVLALGVPRELVLQDYLLTNQFYRHPPVPASETPAEALAVLWRVQQSFLEAALHAVDNEQGGVDVYLRQRLGLSSAALETLATRYLQGA